jgi:O-phospho-L-seryl-tRNASec:L-selenocysteinyl-tRNA synthase
VQSSDKNFMTPVGGAVLLAPLQSTIDSVAGTYAGRASSAPIVDLLATLLWLGKDGWMSALKARKELSKRMCAALYQLAAHHGERVLLCSSNPISSAMTVGVVTAGGPPTELGSMLFQRGVTGCRVVAAGSHKMVGTVNVSNWGASAPGEGGYIHGPYLTVASAVGQTERDVEVFCSKFTAAVKAFRKRFPLTVSVAASAAHGAPSAWADLSGEGAAGMGAAEAT